jgi:hypothetical protein
VSGERGDGDLLPNGFPSHPAARMRRLEQLTLRGIDRRAQRVIRALARREGISLNKAAVRLLEKGAGLVPQETTDRIGNSLDHLFGTWSEGEAATLLESIMSCGQIDEELWK